MKAFLVLVILGAVGWFGYQWVSADSNSEEVAAQDESSSNDVSAEGDGFGAALVASDRNRASSQTGSAQARNGQSAASADNASNARSETTQPSASNANRSGNGASATLPEAMQKLRQRSDARWEALVEAGHNPVAHADSIALARDYSRVLRATYGKPGLSGLAEELIAQRLHPLAESIFFSPTPFLDDSSGLVQSHVVQSGENPNDIGRGYGMSYQFINILRGADPESGTLSVGERLKVFDLKERGYKMYISKSEFQMDLYIADIFARRYDVGIGEDITPTPAGTTHITAREREPQWTDPKTNRVYDFGHPDHIIGPVWLAFDPKIGRNGLGIHGYTGSGNAVGTRESNGCVRMRNDEVRELYNILVPCATTRDGRFISRAPMSVTIFE